MSKNSKNFGGGVIPETPLPLKYGTDIHSLDFVRF